MKRRKFIPTAVERLIGPDEYIISTADTTGRIISVNDVFVKYSGYSREELLNQQHNIIRHPDMPRAVFWLTWEALLAGEDFYGYVKNLGKDGSFYWVFSHILPEHDSSGEIVGYRSVRRAPRPEAVAAVAKLYDEMLAAERVAGAQASIPAGIAVLGRFLGEQGLSYEQLVSRL